MVGDGPAAAGGPSPPGLLDGGANKGAFVKTTRTALGPSRAAILCLLAWLLSAAIVWAGNTGIVLDGVAAAEAARVVSEVTGVRVTVTGGAGKRVTLDLPPAEQGQAVQRLAAALDGAGR